MNKNPRVAIVHDFLIQSGGAEEVLREIVALFPEANIFTMVYDPKRVPEDFALWKIEPLGWSRRLPNMHRWYKYYMPLYPTMIEQIDLREFDLVISSSYLVAHGVLTRANTAHLCYCHTPMRQAWELYFDYKHDYTKTGFRLKRDLFKFFYPIVFNYVRMWDKIASSRVDYYSCNSATTQKRISKYYGRTAEIIYPPVHTEKLCVRPESEVGDFYLCLSRLVPYKRIDLAVEAFRRLDLPLMVAGDGPQLKDLKKLAGPKTKFLGRVDEETKIDLLERCKALVFPAFEDFGIVPVEAQAAGRPVIAFGMGGASESIIHEQTGLLFEEQSIECLISAVEAAALRKWDSELISKAARRFDVSVFRETFKRWVEERFEEFLISK